MTGSYMVILTAFLADNGKNLPLATGAHRRLLATVGSCAATGAGTSSWPLPGCRDSRSPGPARCLATAQG